LRIIFLVLTIFNFLFCVPKFFGYKAYNHILKQCSFGPRNPGSQGHINFKNYLVEYLKEYSDSLIVDTHEIVHPYNKDKNLELFNILSQFNLNAEKRILLMAHWDTREIADKDLDISNYNTPILGANDGASGVAILMEFASIFNDNRFKNLGIDLLFVDAEDMGRSGDLEHFSVGTKLFSKNITQDQYLVAICLDMVADIDPEFKIEYFSYLQGKEFVYEIWDLANSLGYKEFSYDITQPIYDDHRAFYEETKIPSIDIIDFDYPYWHTIEDTPNKCSSYTLEIVGTVMLEYLYKKDEE